MESKANVVAARITSDRVPLRGMTLVNPRKPNDDTRNAQPGDPLFSAAEMRHNFAIWTLERSGTSRRRLHLYYCVRCKWAFQVENSTGSVMPLDQNGNPIQEPEAAQRLATFGVGPCPLFGRLTGSARLTQVITDSDVRRGRLATLFYAMRRIWKTSDRSWRRTASLAGRQKGSILQ